MTFLSSTLYKHFLALSHHSHFFLHPSFYGMFFFFFLFKFRNVLCEGFMESTRNDPQLLFELLQHHLDEVLGCV